MPSSFLRRMSVCFAAGCFGAVIHSILVWYLGTEGLPQQFGVVLAPGWSKQLLYPRYFYPRLVWGGLWGLIFMLPIWRTGFWTGVFSRGILFSFVPTAFQLFYVFPFLMDKGMPGYALGRLTPLFVCLFNAVWGFCTTLWIYSTKE